MNLVKERNFICAYDSVIKVGAWNILTGEFFGKKGNPVKKVPACFTYNNLPSYIGNNADNLLGYIIYFYRTKANYDVYTTERAKRLEQLISLGLYVDRFSDLDDATPLKKDFVNYLKENCHCRMSSNATKRFILEKKINEHFPNSPLWVKECLYWLSTQGEELSEDYILNMINRCILERVNYAPNFIGYGQDTIGRKIAEWIKQYYTISMLLYEKVEIKHNFLSEIAKLYYLENEYKTKNYNKVLANYNDKPWLYFEDENLIAKPILTKEDFHYEGENQHNCVERYYMAEVINGKTHIVSIRKKESPNETFITCEVTNAGKIKQYLTKCNSTNYGLIGVNFKEKYQKYLYENVQ